MATVEWHTLLAAQIPMASAVAAELSRQLVSQARSLAGVALDDGHHAFMPPDRGFTVQYQDIGGATIASVEGELVGPDAEAHPAVLAWRSTAGADPHLTSERGADDLEFFWWTFPATELARPTRIDAADWLAHHRVGFEVELELHTLPGVWLQVVARTAFTPEQVTAVAAAVDAAITAWNQHGPTRVHYRGELEVLEDRHAIAIYIDLGTSQLEGLAAILRAIDASSAGAAVSRCRVGLR
jgi:hypothetical protein